MLARIEDGQVTLWSRNATNFTAHPPRICEGLARLPVRSALIDGEARLFCGMMDIPTSSA
jgi:ATP-dependent DNA ligase